MEYTSISKYHACNIVFVCTIIISFVSTADRLAGWLSIPARSKGRFSWKKQFVVVSAKKILFFETDQENAVPSLVIDIE